MTPVSSVLFCSLLCLHYTVHAASTDAKKERRLDTLYNLDHLIDWKCTNDLDCTAIRSKCVDDKCQCPSGYIYNVRMTSCLKVAKEYGDQCEETIQCSRYLLSGASCIDNACVCSKGYYYIHGRCQPHSELFGTCQKDDDCFANSDFEATSCDKGVCKCSPGFYQREHRACRRAGKGVGDECTMDFDCVFDEKARCVKNKCTVDASYDAFTSTNHSTSWNTYAEGVRVGSECKADADCKVLGNAVCDSSGTCVCERAHFAEDGLRCIPELGEPCQSTDPVIIKKSLCRDGRWSCNAGNVASKNNRECLKVTRMYEGSCRFDEQCYVFGPDAYCDKKCYCNEKSRFVKDQFFCWTTKGIGETCKADLDCHVDGINAALSCKENVCSCPEGTRPNTNGTACVESSAAIGMTCEADTNCAPDNSECRNEVCACVDNHYELDGRCVAGVNATCATSEDCFPKNSICLEDTCTCKENYVSASTDTCLPEVSYGESCQEDVQCSTRNAVCSSATSVTVSTAEEITDKTCVCSEGYRLKKEACFEIKVLGDSCKFLGECYLSSNEDRVVCRKGVCACDWNYAPLNETFCTPSPGAEGYGNNSAHRAVSGGSLSILLSILTFFCRDVTMRVAS